MQNKPKPLNTSLLTLVQFIGAILVITLHCRRLFEADQLHFIQKSIFSRMVVPYFMVTASFFLRRNYPQPLQTIPHPLQQTILDLGRTLPALLPHLPNTPRNPLPLLSPRTPSRTDLHRQQLPTLVHARFLSRSYPRPFFLGEMGLAHHSLSSLPSLSSRLSRNLLLLPGRIDFPDRI